MTVALRQPGDRNDPEGDDHQRDEGNLPGTTIELQADGLIDEARRFEEDRCGAGDRAAAAVGAVNEAGVRSRG